MSATIDTNTVPADGTSKVTISNLEIGCRIRVFYLAEPKNYMAVKLLDYAETTVEFTFDTVGEYGVVIHIHTVQTVWNEEEQVDVEEETLSEERFKVTAT
jgi:hypothetical protein